jgi:hypothetical protein
MRLLHLHIILLSFINISKCQPIAMEFTSKDINDSQNYVTFTPEPNVGFKSGLTICIRVKFEFWNLKSVFNSNKIQLNVFPFSLKRVTVRLEDIWLNVKWPDPKIRTATTWYLLHKHFFFTQEIGWENTLGRN